MSAEQGAKNPGADHPMTQLLMENALKLIAALIWKHRDRHPNMAVEIKDVDLEAMATAFGGKRLTVAVIGKKDSITLQLVDTKTGEALALESALDKESPFARGMTASLAARKRAPGLADEIDALPASMGSDVDHILRESSRLLRELTWEPR